MGPRALTELELESFRTRGFVVVRGVHSPARIEQMRAAVRAMLDRAAAAEASGDGPKVAWINREKRLPARMNDYLEPQKFDVAYADFLADCVPHLQQLVAGEVRHDRFQMLASGDGQSYRLRWHRDWQFVAKTDGPAADSVATYSIAANGQHVEWSTPLLDNDQWFQCVPGSHRRPNTDAETAAILSDDLDVACPGAETLKLEPGDTCYFDAGLIHRGYNPEGVQRWTFVNVAWAARVPVMFDYEPIHEALHIKQVLSDPKYSINPIARRYLQLFVDGVEAGEGTGDKASFRALASFPRATSKL